MIADEPPPVISPFLGLRAGVLFPRDAIVRLSPTYTLAASDTLGTGETAQLDLGIRFFGAVSLLAFGQRAWFSCGTAFELCNGNSDLLGAEVRLEAPRGRVRPYVEIGVGHRRLDAGTPVIGGGTSASISYWQRAGVAPRGIFTGTDLRVGIGATTRIARTFDLELGTDVSLGRFSRWKNRPIGNVDPNAPILPGEDLSDDERTLHTFLGISLGVRWSPY